MKLDVPRSLCCSKNDSCSGSPRLAVSSAKVQNSRKWCRVLDKVSFSIRFQIPFGIRIHRLVFLRLIASLRWVLYRRHRAVELVDVKCSLCALALSKTLVLRNFVLFQTISSILLQHRLEDIFVLYWLSMVLISDLVYQAF